MTGWIIFGVVSCLIIFISPIWYYAVKEKKCREFEALVAHTLERQHFTVEKAYPFDIGRVYLDHQRKRGAFLPLLTLPEDYRKTPMSRMLFFPLDHITECALVQDGTMVHHDAVFAGMAGAALFGLGGALAGTTAMNSAEHVGHLSVRLFLDDPALPSLTITVLNTSMIKSSNEFLKLFDSAQQLYNEFEGIVRMNRRALQANEKPPMQSGGAPASNGAASAAQANVDGNARILEQIKHLAAMHTEGILTDEEFAAKKKMLLDRMA